MSVDLRSLLGSLQLPVAAVGAVLVAASVGGIATMPPPPPDSEGFVSGLAVLVLYFLGWCGVVVTALGLAIPPGDGVGVEFGRGQRGLFVLAAVAALLSAVGPFAAFGLVLSSPSLAVGAWLALTGTAVLALAAGLLWRGLEAARTWRLDRGSAPAGD